MLRRELFLTFGATLAIALAGIRSASADELKRRGMIGVQLAPVNEEVKTRLNLSDLKGILISGVMPNTAAEKAGLAGNDVLVKIGDDEIPGLRDLQRILRKYGAGDTVKFTVIRESQNVVKELTLLPRPFESSPDYEVIYETAGEPGKRVRVLLTRPKSGEPGQLQKFPAVLLVPGPMPQSIEFGPQGSNPFKDIVIGLTQAGFATIRVDRPGLGDSEGLDVHDNTIETDAAAYRAALARVGSFTCIDPDNVFLFAHSGGTAIASQILQKANVKGVATYAAFVRPWAEHSMEASAPWKLELLKDEELKTRSDQEKTFIDECYRQKRSPREILASHPDMKAYADTFLQDESLIFGIHYKYMQELATLDLQPAWSRVNANVLAIWGEGDFSASKTDSELLASLVNKAQPGKARFLSLPRCDHGFRNVEDQEESFLAEGGGKFNPVIIETLTTWMKEISGKKPS